MIIHPSLPHYAGGASFLDNGPGLPDAQVRMPPPIRSVECLLALPPAMAPLFNRARSRDAALPPARAAGVDLELGTGAAFAAALRAAWLSRPRRPPFEAWLAQGVKAVVAGPDTARSLPAYGPGSVSLLPVPVFRWARGQRLDQTLYDLQAPQLEQLGRHAGSWFAAVWMRADVLPQLPDRLPEFPAVDVLAMGLWAAPDRLRDNGVFCCSREEPGRLAFFHPKPSEGDLREWMGDYLCLADMGVWLLSARAVLAIMRRAFPQGLDAEASEPRPYDLQSQFARSLGAAPLAQDAQVARLTCACLPLPEARVYPFNTSRRIITSTSGLQNTELDEIKLGVMGARRHPDTYLQNSRYLPPLKYDQNHTVWGENSIVGRPWKIHCEHVITGVPDEAVRLELPRGVCVDFVPVGRSHWAVRFYGMDDLLAGPLAHPQTRWLGTAVSEWFGWRGLDYRQLGLAGETDLFEAPLFPILDLRTCLPAFLQWLVDPNPSDAPAFRHQYAQGRRLSAREVNQRANLPRWLAQRDRLRAACLEPMLLNHRFSVFYKLDLAATARQYAAAGLALPPASPAEETGGEPLQAVHDRMFRSAVLRVRGAPGWEAAERGAFQCLSDLLVRDARLAPVQPRATVQQDQIVWGRSPVRLDLAGGWTDTPPYCLEYGGKVVNLAADLNGQPPIQVFARLSSTPEIVLRSIDLGLEQRVRTYEELDTFGRHDRQFALAKAALALAGFHPRFNATGGRKTLAAQLKAFGGGLELSQLSAVPKGSGLGASSILAATLLATLSDLCGLDWDKNTLAARTLAMEQLLTTGGGWQDQAGAIFGGLKLIETAPGLRQNPTVRWLPPHLFGPDFANKSILLYYTGITRLAKNILQEIVRGIFLNSTAHLRTVAAIGHNAGLTYDAIQSRDYGRLAAAVHRSWQLNQALDSGTNPPGVQNLLRRLDGHLAAAKLLGAGGGGFLLLLARDETAAINIRRILAAHPPNALARLVDFSLSESGLQVTRS